MQVDCRGAQGRKDRVTNGCEDGWHCATDVHLHVVHLLVSTTDVIF